MVNLFIAFSAGGLLFAWLGYEAGKEQGWVDCKRYYKPMLDRCRKYDAVEEPR